MTTTPHVNVAAMRALLTVAFSADPATAQKLATRISREFQKAGVSVEVTLAFQTVGDASSAGVVSMARSSG